MFSILNIALILGARHGPESFLLIVFTSIFLSFLIAALATYAYHVGVKKTGKHPLKTTVILNSIFAYGYAICINNVFFKAWYFYIILIVASSFLTGWRMSQSHFFKNSPNKKDE